jgi:hypothetical protein
MGHTYRTVVTLLLTLLLQHIQVNTEFCKVVYVDEKACILGMGALASFKVIPFSAARLLFKG